MIAVKTIDIAGGGAAGTTLAQDLKKSLPPSCRLILLSEESYTTFHPMLAEVVGASVFPEQVIAPIRQMQKRTQFIMGTIVGIDHDRRVLHAVTLAGEREIAFAHLVFAFGLRAHLDLVAGMREHALPLKQIADQARAHGISAEDVVREVMLAHQARREFVNVGELAALAVFLCTDGGASITATAIAMDNGWTQH
jgi:NADH dehydrogenase FAD-containing subunit